MDHLENAWCLKSKCPGLCLNSEVKTDFCSCGLVTIRDERYCARCNRSIEPKRLNILRKKDGLPPLEIEEIHDPKATGNASRGDLQGRIARRKALILDDFDPQGFKLSPQHNVLIEGIFLGGAGLPLQNLAESTVAINQSGFMVVQDENHLWKKSFEGLQGIQISGAGVYETGGGWVGGGLGVAGALQGAGFASIMNALTTKVHNDCIFRFVYPGIDATFQVNSHVQRDLEIALSGIRNWLETRSFQDSTTVKNQAGLSNAEQLEKLWNLHQSGVLSLDEFNIEKKKLIG